MVASIMAQELEEDLAGVVASVSNLVGASEGESMASKTWDFGESSITEEMIVKMEMEGYFKAGQAKPPPVGRLCLRRLRATLLCLGTISPVAFACPPSASFARFLKFSISRSTTLLPMGF
jgi:hypothetical protein